MIRVNGSIAKFEGSAKELTLELTHLLLGFKSTMMKEFDLSEEDVLQVIGECGKIAFMSNEEREKYLDEIRGKI